MRAYCCAPVCGRVLAHSESSQYLTVDFPPPHYNVRVRCAASSPIAGWLPLRWRTIAGLVSSAWRQNSLLLDIAITGHRFGHSWFVRAAFAASLRQRRRSGKTKQTNWRIQNTERLPCALRASQTRCLFGAATTTSQRRRLSARTALDRGAFCFRRNVHGFAYIGCLAAADLAAFLARDRACRADGAAFSALLRTLVAHAMRRSLCARLPVYIAQPHQRLLFRITIHCRRYKRVLFWRSSVHAVSDACWRHLWRAAISCCVVRLLVS